MIKHLVKKKKLFIIVFSLILIILGTITLVFGDAEDKIRTVVMFFVMPFLVYGALRFIFCIFRIKQTLGFVKFVVRFFLLAAAIALIVESGEFVRNFPNGLSPSSGAWMGLIIGTLDEEKKNIQIENDNKELK